MEHNLTLEYNPGRVNNIENALSRKVEFVAIQVDQQISARRATSNFLDKQKYGLVKDPNATYLVALVKDVQTRRF